MINGCIDKSSPRFEDDLRISAAFARRSGASADIVERAIQMQRGDVFPVSPHREEALLVEAGFRDLQLFYAGLSVRGWIASV